MKISHESPLKLLSLSRSYNDYDYALVHLLDIYPEYYAFFQESLKMGREVVLDNSIFELGEAFDMKKFSDWIEKLKPTYYIIPDSLNDYKGTVDNLHKWFSKGYFNKHKSYSRCIGVVQGRTYEEIVKCYEEVDRYCDKIAISFDYSYYEGLKVVRSPTQEERWMRGRQYLIETLFLEGVINTDKPHHLLGVALPQEVRAYGEYKWIESIDTSNPIVHGLFDIKYTESGLQTKSRIKLADLITTEPTPSQIDTIMYNVKQFRKFTE